MPIEHSIGHADRTLHRPHWPNIPSIGPADGRFVLPCLSSLPSAMPIEHSIGHADRTLHRLCRSIPPYNLHPKPRTLPLFEPSTDTCRHVYRHVYRPVHRHACRHSLGMCRAVGKLSSRRSKGVPPRRCTRTVHTVGDADAARHSSYAISLCPGGSVFFFTRPPQCVSLEPRCVQARRSPRRTPPFCIASFLAPFSGHTDGTRRGLAQLRRRHRTDLP